MQADLKATVERKKNELSSEFQPKWWGKTVGLYVHVPFCATSCDFCAFYQVQGDRAGIRAYLDGIEEEAAQVAVAGQELNTCFFGGGTPGLLKASDLQILCETVRRNFRGTLGEWTVEMAPSTVKLDKLKVLKDQGVTRISMGVQSFDDALLDKLGRQHSRKQILKAYDLIREEGFESVNLDLIFAIPGQNEARLKEDIRQAAQLGPDHLSTYCLTFEEDTALFVQLSEGKVALDVELETRLYLTCWEEMERLGYEQYEVSNFARPGKQCLHNANTWKMDQWIGLGPSAASQFRGRRYSNVPDLDRWLEGVKANHPNWIDQSDLNEALLLEDVLIFGLRMSDGVDLNELQNRFGRELTRSQSKTIEALESDGKLRKSGDRIRLTRAGRLLSDAVGSALMV